MDELQNLFKTLIVSDYSIRILHWKIIGMDFGTKHELMDEYHSKLNEFIDEVGEVILMNGGSIPSLAEVISDGFKTLNAEEDYNAGAVIKLAKLLLSATLNEYEKVTNSDIPSDIKSKLEEHMYWIRKELQYKLTRHLEPTQAASEALTEFCDSMVIK